MGAGHMIELDVLDVQDTLAAMDHRERIEGWSHAAERSVIGACLLSAEAMKGCSVKLRPEHFHLPSHRLWYGACLFMHDAGLRPDPLSVVERLERAGALERCGGSEYLTQCVDTTYDPDSWPEHSSLVLKHWALRQFRRLGMDATPNAELDELHLRAESIRMQTAVARPPIVQRLGTGDVSPRRRGVTTGHSKLDELFTCRGFPEKQLSIVVADTGDGKTAFMTNAAIEMARSGQRVLYATFADMDFHDLEERCMKHLTGWSYPPSEPHLEREWMDAREVLSSLQIEIYDACSLHSGYDVETFAVWFEARHAKHPYDAVFIDYCQELRSRSRLATTSLTQAEECASVLRKLAALTGPPFIAGSQVTIGKDGEKDKTMGSRIWQNRAATVIKLKRYETPESLKAVPEEYRSIKHIASMEVTKARFGHRNTVWAIWDAGRVRYQEL
jgi:replicative DNA helicase